MYHDAPSSCIYGRRVFTTAERRGTEQDPLKFDIDKPLATVLFWNRG